MSLMRFLPFLASVFRGRKHDEIDVLETALALPDVVFVEPRHSRRRFKMCRSSIKPKHSTNPPRHWAPFFSGVGRRETLRRRSGGFHKLRRDKTELQKFFES